MNTNSTFSLSLQKEFGKDGDESIDFEIRKAFNELNFKRLLKNSHILKTKGFAAFSILLLWVLLPFLKRKLVDIYSDTSNAQKDVYYRFINCETFNWRRFIYALAQRVIVLCDSVPFYEKILIADDTIGAKSGKNMELVSYHYDHKTGKSKLGYQYLQLAYHNGINLIPLDVVVKTSTKRPNNKIRDIDKRTSGWNRRK